MKLPWGSTPDPGLPLLSTSEADRLRSLFEGAWPRQMGQLTVHADHAVSNTGVQYGFADLAARVRLLPKKDWPALVEQHVETLAAMAFPSPLVDLGELRERGRSRIMPAEFLDPDALAATYSYRREVASGLTEIVMLDYPEYTKALGDDDAASFDYETLWGAARAGLTRESWGEFVPVDTEVGSFRVHFGDSAFTASRALQLEDVLAHAGVHAPLGVVVGLPNRNQLVFHAILDSSALTVLAEMSRFVALGFSDGVGPVSPHLYYWQDGLLECITTHDADGALSVIADGRFLAAIEAAVEDSEARGGHQ